MKNNTDGLEVLSAGSDTMEWVGQGPDALYLAFLLLGAISIAVIAIKVVERNPHACAPPRENLRQAGRKFMRDGGPIHYFKFGHGIT